MKECNRCNEYSVNLTKRLLTLKVEKQVLQAQFDKACELLSKHATQFPTPEHTWKEWVTELLREKI